MQFWFLFSTEQMPSQLTRVTFLENALFTCGRTLTTNHRPLAVSVVVLYRAVNQLFYVGPDRFVVLDVFLSVFGGSIVTIKMGIIDIFHFCDALLPRKYLDNKILIFVED